MKKIEYIPKFTVSGKAMRLIMEIAAALERYKIVMEGPDGVRLRKLNHIRTIRGTTAIEGNTLTEEQITAVLAGKRVAATRREIDEVKGAHRAYAKIESFNAYSVKDLLKAHALMTKGLVERPGEFRKCAVGVMNGAGEVVHLAPRFELVPGLMDDLFAWLADSDEPVLIKSCVFHWCFEDIHPFPDGNGRTGRLWQTVLLGSWNPLFYGAPIENIVWAHQPEYYAAIQAVEEHDMDIAPFIEFMLDKILRTLKAKGEAYEVGEESRVKSRDKSRDKVLCLLRKQPDLTQAELANALGIRLDIHCLHPVFQQCFFLKSLQEHSEPDCRHENSREYMDPEAVLFRRDPACQDPPAGHAADQGEGKFQSPPYCGHDHCVSVQF